MARMSARKAAKIRSLVTGAPDSKRPIKAFPKARAKADEKAYAKAELKNAVKKRANVERNNSGPFNFPDPGTTQRANVRVGDATSNATKAGVSSRGQAKAVSKGLKIVAKRVKKEAKAEVSENKRYARVGAAMSKGQKKVARATDVAEKTTRFGTAKAYKKNTGRSVRSR